MDFNFLPTFPAFDNLDDSLLNTQITSINNQSLGFDPFEFDSLINPSPLGNFNISTTSFQSNVNSQIASIFDNQIIDTGSLPFNPFDPASVSDFVNNITNITQFANIPINPGGGGSTTIYQGNVSEDKIIFTGNGNDYIVAGLGNDTITAGLGADTFVYNSPAEGIDTITDFSVAENDKIQVSGAGFGIGATDFSRFAYDATNGGLYFDDTQLATLPSNLGFDATTNIAIL